MGARGNGGYPHLLAFVWATLHPIPCGGWVGQGTSMVCPEPALAQGNGKLWSRPSLLGHATSPKSLLPPMAPPPRLASSRSGPYAVAPPLADGCGVPPIPHLSPSWGGGGGSTAHATPRLAAGATGKWGGGILRQGSGYRSQQHPPFPLLGSQGHNPPAQAVARHRSPFPILGVLGQRGWM